ncbi:hypothetical protein Tco_0769761 [Tanacetum coccineum]|uniref:Uncharacterized protein n=1 Tax=Tanacetum coccineum TaxID=301880 RepID=A0ABQ4ZBB2_9ASTR
MVMILNNGDDDGDGDGCGESTMEMVAAMKMVAVMDMVVMEIVVLALAKKKASLKKNMTGQAIDRAITDFMIRKSDTVIYQLTHKNFVMGKVGQPITDSITSSDNVNPFVPVPPNELHAKITQEFNEIHAISAMIDSRLENIDRTLIIMPPTAPFEQLLNDFMNPPDIFEMDDLESDDESVDTPLVSPILDSDNELGDGEVLNGLDEYGNARDFYRNKIIKALMEMT